MSPRLVKIAAGSDTAALTGELAPSFGGDPAGARQVLDQTIDLLVRDPRPDPWGSYIAYAEGVPVGICAFKTAPDPAGVVEIAYMTFPVHERRGHARAMAGALASIAFEAGAARVIAHTLPEENPSNRALRSNGFDFAGATVDPEDGPVWRWEKAR